MEQIARYPINRLTVKAEVEQLLAGRFVTYDGKSDEGDFTAVLAAARASRIFGVIERDSADPRADPAPDTNDAMLRVPMCRSGSIARVLCSGEVKDGEEVQVAANGQAVVLSDGTAVGEAKSAGKNSIIEVELY